jgi:hypothetical protein
MASPETPDVHDHVVSCACHVKRVSFVGTWGDPACSCSAGELGRSPPAWEEGTAQLWAGWEFARKHEATRSQCSIQV